MSFFDEYLKKRLNDPEFKREWEESEEEYLKIRDTILERIKRLETDPDSAIKWDDIRKN